MTDITKFKSIAIKIDCYNKAKPIAARKYMSMGAFVRYLIDKECSRRFFKQRKGGSHKVPLIE